MTNTQIQEVRCLRCKQGKHRHHVTEFYDGNTSTVRTCRCSFCAAIQWKDRPQ